MTVDKVLKAAMNYYLETNTVYTRRKTGLVSKENNLHTLDTAHSTLPLSEQSVSIQLHLINRLNETAIQR